jgi:hypothetical protein
MGDDDVKTLLCDILPQRQHLWCQDSGSIHDDDVKTLLCDILPQRRHLWGQDSGSIHAISFIEGIFVKYVF